LQRLAEQEKQERKDEEERLKKAAEEKLQEEIERLKSLVPPEPDKQCGKPVS